MNWGKGITIFLVLFIGFITTLAVILMRANTELVSEDYYIKEIKYSDEIDAEQNARNSGAVLQTEVSESGLSIHIQKEGFSNGIEVHLLRGNNQEQDISITSDGPSAYIDRKDLKKGKYTLTVTWQSDDQPHQLKKEIWIQ